MQSHEIVPNDAIENSFLSNLIFDSIHLLPSFLFNFENSLLTVEKMSSTLENIEVLNEIDVASIKSEASELLMPELLMPVKADPDGKLMVSKLRHDLSKALK